MTALATLQANGANASGYAKVGDKLSVLMTGFNNNDASVVTIAGPNGTEVTLDVTLNGTGGLDTGTVGSVICSHEGTWSCSAADAHNNTDTDTLEAWHVG